MGTFINKGNAGFTRYTNGEYVDKTAMIAFINSTLETGDMLTCVTRPRRFGKSIAANMLCAYYDKSCDSSELFDRFVISKDESYRKHLNKYPVIYLDITRFTTTATDKNQLIDTIQQKIILDLKSEYPSVAIAEGADLMDAILAVVKDTGEKFIMIIDEWDALCREFADSPQLMSDYVNLLRRMFKTDDTPIAFAGAYLTGILPIKKYGTQSALNDFCEYSMTNPGPMAGFIGFDDDDVRALAERHGMNYSELKGWYDGYKLYGVNWKEEKKVPVPIYIYNANSVMRAVKSGMCANYWSRSEAFETLQQYIDMNFDGAKETLENLVLDHPITLRALRFGNDQNVIGSNEELYTLLTHFGYLSYDPKEYTAVLPNQEIREEFIEALRGSGSHKELSELVLASDRMLKATLAMDEEAVAEGMEKLHNTKLAPNYYNNEQALRSVVRLAYLGAIDYYLEIQELPSGKGYCDLAFLPRRNSDKPAMIVELKWDETAGAAIDQIKQKDYPAKVAEYTGDILLVGINYNKDTKSHSCKIERQTK